MKSALLLLLIVLSGAGSYAQNSVVTVSGIVKDKKSRTALPYVSVVLKTEKDTAFILGSITDEEGRFILANIQPGRYFLFVSYLGYISNKQNVLVGHLSEFINIGSIELEKDSKQLDEVVVAGKRDEVSEKMDKKTFSLENNISQSGGSVLQTMQNLPGVTVQEGKVQLRGSDKIIVLIDGKQTALTGFGNQSGLDNIPASAIEKIEIINNPSSKYDANGNAGIINIIYKKNKQEGLNGKAGLSSGLGALWVKRDNLPTIRPQYQMTPKINPSLSLNYRKNKINIFFQGDYLYTETLNKNEFVKRVYDDGTIINQQTKRNRNTHFHTSKAGVDCNIDDYNMFTVSGLFGSERITDNGDQPFFNADLSERLRLWQFLEDELKTTVMATGAYQHKYKQPGHLLSIGFNYTFHREDEKYFFDNILPAYTGRDAFKLISDEHVVDLNIDYIRPLKYGRIESGFKFRIRDIPTNMQFIPGLNSPLDTNAGGWATYKEVIPALYGNYVFESKKVEAELGLRIEYVDLQYYVNPNHNTYKSDGYNYTQPFPNLRFAYKINDHNKLSLFYNRRVDRPNELDIRIFPKYDDAEIVKVGNPALRPQFTNTFELGYKTNWKNGYLFSAAYCRLKDGTLTRIRTIVPGNTIIYSVMQNAGNSYTSGLEIVVAQDISKLFSFNLNMNGYHNRFNAFAVLNRYPEISAFSSPAREIISGNAKLNTFIHLPRKYEVQLAVIYMGADLISQGRIGQRFTLDFGIKKGMQKDKGELFINATDLLNTMIIKEDIRGNGFDYFGTDYYETQVIRIGYSYKF